MNEDLLLETTINFLEEKTGKEAIDVEVLHRSERLYSKVWLIRVQINSDFRLFYLKTTKGDISKKFRLTEKANEIFENINDVMLPKVIGILSPNTMIIEKMNGNLLDDFCTWKAKENPVLWYKGLKLNFTKVGRWLRTFHAATYRSDPPDMNAILDYVNKRSNGLSLLPSFTRCNLLNSLKQPLESPVVLTHGDFTPHNILISSDKIGVIDYGIEEWEYMSPWWDVATLVFRVQQRWRNSLINNIPLKICPVILKRILSAMLNEYGEVPESNRAYAVSLMIRYFLAFCSEVKKKKNFNRSAKWYLNKIDLISKNLNSSNPSKTVVDGVISLSLRAPIKTGKK